MFLNPQTLSPEVLRHNLWKQKPFINKYEVLYLHRNTRYGNEQHSL